MIKVYKIGDFKTKHSYSRSCLRVIQFCLDYIYYNTCMNQKFETYFMSSGRMQHSISNIQWKQRCNKTYVYMHNWSFTTLQSGLRSNFTTYVVRFNFIHEWRESQFKVDSKLQIFEKLFMAILFTLRNLLDYADFIKSKLSAWNSIITMTSLIRRNNLFWNKILDKECMQFYFSNFEKQYIHFCLSLLLSVFLV